MTVTAESKQTKLRVFLRYAYALGVNYTVTRTKHADYFVFTDALGRAVQRCDYTI